MARTITCTNCWRTLAVRHDAPKCRLFCPRCLMPLPEIRKTDRHSGSDAESAPSCSAMTAEELANQVQRDRSLGTGAAVSVLVLSLVALGVILNHTAGIDFQRKVRFLLVFGLIDGAVVIALIFWMIGRLSGSPEKPSVHSVLRFVVTMVVVLGILAAGFQMVFVTCSSWEHLH